MSYSLGFRYNIHEETDLKIFEDIILGWIDKHKIKILKSTGGEHANASSLHIHVQYIIESPLPFKTPPLQQFKNNNPDFALQKNQMSIIYKQIKETEEFTIEEQVIRFLQYALKEDKPLWQFIHNIEDVDQMCKDAKAEYKATQIFQKKKKAEQDRKKSKKLSLFAHLDETRFNSLVDVCNATLTYYKKIEDAPHPRTQIQSAETYSYHRGIWSHKDILLRYLPKQEVETNYARNDLLSLGINEDEDSDSDIF